MKLWKRRIILTLAILLFVILSPAIILYSSGYRLNLNDFSLKKVGMIIIESTPREINVIINNKLLSDRTPFKKSNLAPKDYFIKLEKENYQSWGKNLSVESQTVTWITNVILFLTEPSLDIYAQDNSIIESKLSPDEDYYAYISKTNKNNYILKLLNTNSRENINIFDLNDYSDKKLKDFKANNISNVLWSNNSQYVLLTIDNGNNRKNIVLDTKELDKEPALIEDSNIESIMWDINDENFIYYLFDQQLKKLNINNQEISTKIAENVTHFDLVDNSIIYTKNIKQNDEQFSSIYLVNKNKSEINSEEIYESLNIINEEITDVEAVKEDRYLFSTDEKKLYLVNNSNIIKIADDIKSYEWSDKEKFLYYSDDILGHYYIEEDKDTCHPEYKLNQPVEIINQANKIDYAAWYPDAEHILYSSDGQINIIELDSRDIVNVSKILSDCITNKQNPIYFNDDGDKLFFIQKLNDIFYLTQATLYLK